MLSALATLAQTVVSKTQVYQWPTLVFPAPVRFLQRSDICVSIADFSSSCSIPTG
jgi:hypothetical protein